MSGRLKLPEFEEQPEQIGKRVRTAKRSLRRKLARRETLLLGAVGAICFAALVCTKVLGTIRAYRVEALPIQHELPAGLTLVDARIEVSYGFWSLTDSTYRVTGSFVIVNESGSPRAFFNPVLEFRQGDEVLESEFTESENSSGHQLVEPGSRVRFWFIDRNASRAVPADRVVVRMW